MQLDMRSLLGLQEEASSSEYNMSVNSTILPICNCQFQI